MRAREEIEGLIAAHGVIAVANHPRLARTIQRLCVRGLLVRMLPGIYAASGTQDDERVRILAVMAKDPNAVITGNAALAMVGSRSRNEVIEFHSARQLRLPKSFRQHRSRIPSDHVLTRGIVRFTHPTWSALQLASRDGGAAIDEVLRQRQSTLEHLNSSVSSFTRKRGNQTRRRILWESRDQPWSQGERALHGILRTNRITGWITNFGVECDGKRRYLDIAFPKLRLAIEFDGREFHSSAAAFEDDRERQNALVAQGWTVLRITWAMLNDPERIVGLVRELTNRLRPRLRSNLQLA